MADRNRDAAVERICRVYQQRWADLNEVERASAVNRICETGGISRVEAVQRVSNAPCPKCSSTDMDRGDKMDICRWCGQVVAK